MKYSEYPYERIDLDKFKNKIELMINDFSNAESAEKQIKIILEYQEIQKEYHSFGSIAHLNYARNTHHNFCFRRNLRNRHTWFFNEGDTHPWNRVKCFCCSWFFYFWIY